MTRSEGDRRGEVPQGSQVLVRPVVREDLGRVAAFLAQEFEPIAETEWVRALDYPWLAEKPNYGFLAEHDGQIVGFIGAAYSRRRIEGRSEDLCNLHSWAVLPAYRRKRMREAGDGGGGGKTAKSVSIGLLRTALAQPGYTYTSLTARDEFVLVLRQLGYRPLESHRMLLFPLCHPWSMIPAKLREVATDEDLSAYELPSEAAQVLRDHTGLRCRCFVLSGRGKYCALVMRRIYVAVLGRKLPASEMMYASDPRLLVRHLEYAKLRLLRAQHTACLVAEPRLLGTRPWPYLRTASDYLYKSDHLSPADVDALYSELVLLPV